jgi:hypothetical protein
MHAAETMPETIAMMALAVLLDISILALQIPQLVTEKLLSSRNFLIGILPLQLGQQAILFLDIGFQVLFLAIPVSKLDRYCLA